MSLTQEQVAGMYGISVEQMRKARVVVSVMSDGRDLLMSGEYSVNELYRRVVGDDRVSMSVRLPRGLRDVVNEKAAEHGMTQERFVVAVLALFLEYDGPNICDE